MTTKVFEIPCRPGQNADALVRLRLAEIIPGRHDQLYFDYTRKRKCLAVRYCEDVASSERLKRESREIVDRKTIKIILVWSLILLAVNSFMLWKSREINHQHWREDLIHHNRLNRLQAGLMLAKEVKGQNIRLARFLEALAEMPVYLELVEIVYPHVEVRVVAQDRSNSEETIRRIGRFVSSPSVKTQLAGSTVRIWVEGEL